MWQAFSETPTNQPRESTTNITPAQQLENIPGAMIVLADDFRFEVQWTTPGGPVIRGTLDKCLTGLASEQGWSPEDLSDTIAYNAAPR